MKKKKNIVTRTMAILLCVLMIGAFVPASVAANEAETQTAVAMVATNANLGMKTAVTTMTERQPTQPDDYLTISIAFTTNVSGGTTNAARQVLGVCLFFKGEHFETSVILGARRTFRTRFTIADLAYLEVRITPNGGWSATRLVIPLSDALSHDLGDYGWRDTGRGQLTYTVTVQADTTPQPPVVTPEPPRPNNDVGVTIDGERVAFTDQAPVIVDGRTLVPARNVFEALGFYVEWCGVERAVTLTRCDDVVILTIDSDTFTTNGESFQLDVPAQIINERTLLPIRLPLESVGYYVGWDNDTRTVLISAEPIE